MLRILTTTLAALAAAPVALGHSWIEQLRNVNDKGEYVGDYGYSRGMVAKTDPGYNSDTSMVWKLPRPEAKSAVFIDETTSLCNPNQVKAVQSAKYPRLQTAPGGQIVMRYTENGHVTEPLPDGHLPGKPEKGGTVFVYGTTEPKDDETLFTVLQWTQDGKGGNGKGILLATNDYDDGRCYEINPTAKSKERQKTVPNFITGQVTDGPGNTALQCETHVQLPESAEVGKPYTFYWVWQWNSAPSTSIPTGKDEYYTTCIDVDVASKDVAQAADAAGPNSKFAVAQQDAMSVAVSNFASRTAMMTDVVKGEIGPIFSGKATGSPSTPTSVSNPGPSDARSSGSSAPAPSSKAPVASSQAPAPSSVSAPSSKTPGQPTIPTLTRRPGASPTSKTGGNMVTVTDTVYLTVTADIPAASKSPAAGTSKRAVTSIKSKAPPSGFTSLASKAPRPSVAPTPGSQSPPSAAPSQLPGFNMRNGAKFRGIFK